MGRNKLPEGMKRVRIFGRVNPSTVDFFKSLGEINDGRAMDKTVHLARGMQTAVSYLEQNGVVITETPHPTMGSAPMSAGKF